MSVKVSCCRRLVLLGLLGFAGAAFAYAPGDGTGLSTVLMGPVNTGSYGISPYNQFSYREVTTAYPNINIDQVGKAKTMFPSGTNFTKWVAMWRGKLIVPETGTYWINFRRQENNDGLRFTFDGQTLCSRYTYADSKEPAIVSNRLELAAGTYPIEVDWCPNRPSSLAWHTLVMSWSNDQSITDEEVIPSSQFIPAAEADLPDYRPSALDGYTWNWSSASGGYRFPVLKRLGTNSYEVSGTKQVNITGWTPIFGKEVTGPFVAETTVDLDKDSDGYIALRFPGNTTELNAMKNTIFFIYYWNNNNRESSRYAVWYSQGNNAANVEAWKGNVGGIPSPARLRVARDENGRIVFSIRGSGQDWKEVACWQSGGVGEDGYPVDPSGTRSFETADRAFVGFGSQQIQNLGGSETKTSLIRNPYIGASAAPTNVVVTRNDLLARTAQVDFLGAVGAQQIQYRLVGTNEWTNYGGPLAAGVTNCVLTGLAYPNSYELRIVSAGDTLGVSESPLAKFDLGYGLIASMEGPYSINYGNTVTGCGQVREVQYFSQPYANLKDDKHIFATTNVQTALVCWRGNLIVPVSGTYSLRMEASKYAPRSSLRLVVDGQVLHDEYGATLAEFSGNWGYVTHEVELTAGTHPLEIDWLTMAPKATLFKLLWSRAANEEKDDPGFEMVQIPHENFTPAAVEDLPRHTYDGFTLDLPGTTALGTGPLPVIARLGETDYALTAVKTDASIAYMQPSFTKRQSGRFTATGTFYLDEIASQGQAGLICRGPDSTDCNNWIAILCDKTQAAGPRLLFTGSVKPDDANMYNASGYEKVSPNGGNFDAVKFRIRRKADKTLRFSYAYRAADTKAWSQYTSWADYLGGTNYVASATKTIAGGVLTNDTLSVGIISSTREQSVVRDLKVLGPQGLTIIVR